MGKTKHMKNKDFITLDDFNVGDLFVLTKKFSIEDYGDFYKISMDANPLHHKKDYGKKSEFAQIIVPLHLAISPFSFIAGMVIPGESSLYLGHEVRANEPIFYNEELNYSAKIININRSLSVITISVIVTNNDSVKVEAKLKIKSILNQWEMNDNYSLISKSNAAEWVLVTGSTGSVGMATSKYLAKKGYKLLLQYNKKEELKEELSKFLKSIGATFEFIKTDLTNNADFTILLESIRSKRFNLSGVIHTASSKTQSTLGNLVATNYSSLKKIIETVLPNFLIRQGATVIFVSSIYVKTHVLGFENYTSVKSMTISYLNGLFKNYSRYGLRFKAVFPGLIDSEFSEDYKGPVSKLLPEEVAEVIVNLYSDSSVSRYLTIESNNKEEVDYGVFSINYDSQTKLLHNENPNEFNTLRDGTESLNTEKLDYIKPLNIIFKKVLGLNDSHEIVSESLGVTPGWDSLSHIELIVEIESYFNINFSSSEIVSLNSYELIKKALENHLGKK